jgi:hypothetical protein
MCKVVRGKLFKAGLLGQFAACSVIERFIYADETSGQRSFPFERLLCALDQQHFEFACAETKNHAVHS